MAARRSGVTGDDRHFICAPRDWPSVLSLLHAKGARVSAAKVTGSAAAGPVLRLEHVSKVFCDSLNVARRYAMTDLLRPQRGRESKLRKHEFLALHDVSLELEKGQTLLVLGVPD